MLLATIFVVEVSSSVAGVSNELQWYDGEYMLDFVPSEYELNLTYHVGQ